MLNVSVFLEDSARTFPQRDAVVIGSVRLTYAQVDAAANQVANLLVDRGIQPGDKVALSCPNLPWFPIIYYGTLKAGAVVVPLNVLLKGREVGYHLRDSQARAYFCFQDTVDLEMATEGSAGFEEAPGCEHLFIITAEPVATSPIAGSETLAAALEGQPPRFDTLPTETEDTAVILYTSGTTGQAKGAELTHANLVLNALTAERIIDARPGQDTHLVALPLFHAFGQSLQMNTGFLSAATLVLVPRFDAAQVVQILRRETITHFAAVPTMYWGLLKAFEDGQDVRHVAANLRTALSGGASMPTELLRQVKDSLGVDVLEGYGLSETSPAACFTPRVGEPRPGSIGQPIWGVAMKLIDTHWNEIDDTADAIGEIAIKGHPVMKGYYRRPEATSEAIHEGWFRTGDLARRDHDGYYYIVGRAKEMIIRGGNNVYPRELEEILLTHPAVSMVAVIGVEHPLLGEEVKAVVMRTAGDATTEDDLIAWSKEQFAAYKYPRIFEFRDTLPMNATGKILKRELMS